MTFSFRSLDKFNRLIYQILASLNALGGGGRAAKALKEMHEILWTIYNKYLQYLRDGSDSGWQKIEIGDFVNTMDAAQNVVQEVIDAFQELKESAKILDVEYGYLKSVDFTGDYIEASLLDPLAITFEKFLDELRNVAVNEVEMMRQAQDLSSQRYLNLMTVSTFLSSVTASTLQITANNSESVLSIIVNTMWFTSLVFSTASAVYSLLIMTWRQSPVRQFDNTLSPMPHWLVKSFKNGPVSTLIVAIFAFAIGICVMAFQTAIQQGHIETAVVSTVFAGVHMNLLLLISGWFLWEKWKSKHLYFWVVIKEKLLSTHSKKIRMFHDQSARLLKYIDICRRKIALSLTKLKDSILAYGEHEDDIEMEASTHLSRPKMINTNEQIVRDRDILSTAAQLTVPHVEASSSDLADAHTENSRQSASNHIPDFDNRTILQFSSSSDFLASAQNEARELIVVKDGPYFPAVQTLDLDDKHVKRVIWDESNHLLVQTEQSINIWKISGLNIRISRNATTELMGTLPLDVEPITVHWVPNNLGNEDTFIVVQDNLVKLYDLNCKNIRSIDICILDEMSTFIHPELSDVVLLDSSRVLCVAGFVIGRVNLNQCLITILNKEKDSLVNCGGEKSLTVSKKTGSILLHGSKDNLLLLKTTKDQLECQYIWEETMYYQKLFSPIRSVGFCGKDDELIYGLSGHNLFIFCPETGDPSLYRTLHIYTSPTFPVEISSHTSFSMIPGTTPYRFAFGLQDGSISVWSIQSDNFFKDGVPGVELANIHDRKGADSNYGVSKDLAEGGWASPHDGYVFSPVEIIYYGSSLFTNTEFKTFNEREDKKCEGEKQSGLVNLYFASLHLRRVGLPPEAQHHHVFKLEPFLCNCLRLNLLLWEVIHRSKVQFPCEVIITVGKELVLKRKTVNANCAPTFTHIHGYK
ncbi:WD40 domain containing protein [Pyrrhoderma noxium]|uniref:WD40 domain containing protein n=1 Tax=Pyrrhoderma noxium TaxID=2282107 RepID=A0A286UFS9_9AGAM|nr:WD40 domain containing protein [Pyrrhoderma noxium]